METLTPTVGPFMQNEPIPGYVLRARLGSGGYGEVWEAEVPGGLRKAVKFVYGRLDEARARANSNRSTASRRSATRSCCRSNGLKSSTAAW